MWGLSRNYNAEAMRNLKLTTIIFLSCLCIWMGSRIVVLENYRYASQSGICAEYYDPDTFENFMRREKCLNEAQTRTHWLWHLIYGMELLS